MRRRLIVLFVALFLVPLATHAAWSVARGWPANWSAADWSATGILPPARSVEGARVHVLAARVGRWRGIFAHHTWVVVKPAGADRYRRYDVVGWGSPVRVDHRAPDARWYGNEPMVLMTLDGERAERAIAQITRAVEDYPHRDYGDYSAWPGPNSNTFIAHLAEVVPDIAPALLPTAIGKDFRGEGLFAGPTPSGTGVQLSVMGAFGVAFGWVEGVEINLLGLVAGLDVRRPALKLPGWGRIGLPPA
jgi:hypothetical protein